MIKIREGCKPGQSNARIVPGLNPTTVEEIAEVMSIATITQPPSSGVVNGFYDGTDQDFIDNMFNVYVRPGMIDFAVRNALRVGRADALIIGGLEVISPGPGNKLLVQAYQPIAQSSSFGVQIPVYKYDGGLRLDQQYETPQGVLTIQPCCAFFDLNLLKDEPPFGDLFVTEGLGSRMFEQVLREPLEKRLETQEGLKGVAVGQIRLKQGQGTKGELVGIASMGLTYFS
ncbi:hypothetical protein HN592_03030 [Candidatus Woesearchaeota archaeon]|jgi:hypothetical protein|nr:hypothetical protein [Candidatus Woesearchaeota archaeon]MBT4368187.1 hypothetical protein [Candidatus Woesearchaeota archaeon]MBT4712675.1 hypothetical protein [Candidatus Woesearchaeota archaeon]MBT6639588.1 hypothetical protein [Candidatus Woesearchaeota archaeon]MBT7133760.1 hypothetical protein [Candidatus Woesearchaeota archaeon]